MMLAIKYFHLLMYVIIIVVIRFPHFLLLLAPLPFQEEEEMPVVHIYHHEEKYVKKHFRETSANTVISGADVDKAERADKYAHSP